MIIAVCCASRIKSRKIHKCNRLLAKYLPVFLLFLCLAVPQTARGFAARETAVKAPLAPIPGLPEVPSFTELYLSFFPEEPTEEQITLQKSVAEVRPGPCFAIVPENIHPGEPLAVAYMDDFTGGGTYRAVLLDSRERRLGRAPFFTFTHDPQGREVKAALLAIPSTAKAEKMIIRIEGSNGVFIEELSLLVEGRDYAAEVIELDQRNTEIRTVPDPQKTAESEQLWAVISRTGSALYAQAPFLPPVTSTRRTSFFGDRRVYHYVNGSTDTSVHAGVDYGVPTGTEVRACAPGKVVLARSRIVTGNSIAVEHLPGVYSLYYHLDEIKISEGDLVEEGALLGLSGSTGLATGPHLHWEIRVAGENTDPDAFTARPVLDKDEILSKLSSGSF